jgi:hypothetical protein
MANRNYKHNEATIFDIAKDAIVANPKAPEAREIVC